MLAERVRLLGIEAVGQDAGGAARQCEHFVVPLKRAEAVAAAEPGIGRRVDHLDLAPADFRRRRAFDPGAERLREELPAEAMADHGHVGRHRVAKKVQQGRIPRQIVVGAHRAAHHADACESARVGGHGIAAVQREELVRDALRVEPVTEMARPFGARKTEMATGFTTRSCRGCTGSGAWSSARSVATACRDDVVNCTPAHRARRSAARAPGRAADQLEQARVERVAGRGGDLQLRCRGMRWIDQIVPDLGHERARHTQERGGAAREPVVSDRLRRRFVALPLERERMRRQDSMVTELGTAISRSW